MSLLAFMQLEAMVLGQRKTSLFKKLQKVKQIQLLSQFLQFCFPYHPSL